MDTAIVNTSLGISLITAGLVSRRDLSLALARAPILVAADGGANRALALGHRPEAVVGDFDSITPATLAALNPARLHKLDEQETTDFHKALRLIRAPFVIGLGCLGGRLDHELAVLNALVCRSQPPCVLLGSQDVAFAAPAGRWVTLALTPGDRLSLFPLAPVSGESEGLEWPIRGLQFRPDGRIGTSNRAAARAVRLRFDAPGMIVILPRRRLDAALAAVTSGPSDAAPRV